MWLIINIIFKLNIYVYFDTKMLIGIIFVFVVTLALSVNEFVQASKLVSRCRTPEAVPQIFAIKNS